MPTGTGKTGIIAFLTRLACPGSSLVLTPWANLRDQMVRDLKKRFWSKIDFEPPERRVASMFPSKVGEVLKRGESQVIVATFAALTEIRREHPLEYASLAKELTLVIVDEGHYEPAVDWGRSVKGLKRKTLLLTATPYRNDLKLFRIADRKSSSHHFTHADATKRGIIRALQIQDLSSGLKITDLASAFADRWTAAKRSRSLASPRPRAIVCCAGHEDIQTTVSVLRRKGLNAVGVHERFEPDESHLRREVPDPKQSSYEVWVHQQKLTEGLDDHRFCCLALFTQFRNDRKLIQQVGRILRRDSGDRNAPALLLAPREYSPGSEWSAYLDYETKLELLTEKHYRNFVERMLKAQPEVEYFDGQFRRRFEPASLTTNPQVIIPPSVLVRQVTTSFSLDEYIDECTDVLNLEDAVILGGDPNAPCQRSASNALWVYASFANSRSLQRTSLYEIRVETHCVSVAGDFLFVTDSQNNVPGDYVDDTTVPVDPGTLGRYLTSEFTPTHLGLNSTIPYDTVARGADIRGHNLASVPISLTDRVHICRSARGGAANRGVRYVGLQNGRLRDEVSEVRRRTYGVAQFLAWTAGVAAELGKSKRNPIFARYMPTSPPPPDPIPKTICLDLFRSSVRLTTADDVSCELLNSSSSVRRAEGGDGFEASFHTTADPKAFGLNLVYEPRKRRFWFSKGDGPSIRVTADQEAHEPKSLASFLNQKQDAVLIGLEGGNLVYQGRTFYRVDYSHAEKSLISLIQHHQGAAACQSEKGTEDQIAESRDSRAKVFPSGSIFRAIANTPSLVPFKYDLLICDDMGSECADFIAANIKARQLALIHAKIGKGQKISASAFHDVVAQAMKNLAYLAPNSETPKGAGNWAKGKVWKETRIPRLLKVPPGFPQGKDIWLRLRSEIIENSNPRLFVVLAVAGCCDKAHLQRAVDNEDERTAEVAQLLHLIDGLNGHARQLGAQLVVNTLPFREDTRRRKGTTR